MTVRLFTDPHLGLNRAANCTPASRARLQDALYQKALEASAGSDFTVCLGDLLDKFSNSEATIRQAAHITARCDLVLAGNHDLTARADSVSTLHLLSDSFPDTILIPKFNEPCAENTVLGHVAFTSIPHVLTKELFDESIDMAIEHGPTHIEGQTTTSACLLHCNYEIGYEVNETTLNLTEEQARRLLEVYNTIFLGHEHIPRTLLDGRLIILGNIFPTGFSDISDKRVIIMDDDGIHSETIWRAEEHYEEINANLLDDYDATGIEFLRITGDVKPEDVTRVSKQVAKIWKQEDSPYAIKLDIEILRDSDEVKPEAAGSLLSLPERIERELAGNPLLPFWEEFKNELR